MLSRIGLLQILGLSLAAIPEQQAVAAEKVGAITYLVAWRNTQPPNNKNHCNRQNNISNPCYKAEAEPLMSSDKSLLKIKITLKPDGDICIQKNIRCRFRYERDGTGNIILMLRHHQKPTSKRLR